MGPPVVLVLPDPQVAARVQIVGANPAENAAARSALARLGARNPVRRVVFADHGVKREIQAQVRNYKEDPTGGFETEWLGKLFLADLAGTLHARGEIIDWVEFRAGSAGDGTGIEPSFRHLHPRSQAELRALAERAAGRATRTGHRLEPIVAYGASDGALKVIVRLTKREFLKGTNTRWIEDLAPERSYSTYLLVLGPGGIPVAYGANFGQAGGAWAYGPTARSRSIGPPPLEGPFDLDVRIARRIPKQQNFEVPLSCATSSTRKACIAFRRDWVRLLPPVAADTTCLGPVGIDEISIRGVVGGIRVRRDYSGCYGGVIARWERLLGVPTRR